MSTSERSTPATTSELSRERAVEVAIALAEEKDVQTVSIRQVAKRLGVTPMALYWHFRNKDDLLDAMVGWLYGQMDFTIDESATWQEQLRSIIDAEVAVLRTYPQTAMLILSRGSTSPNALTEVETILGVLRQGGFSPSDASRVLTYLETIVSLVARESLLAAPGEDDGDWQRQVQTTIQALPADQFPNIIDAAEHLSSAPDPDAYYAFGIDLLMAGIEAMALRSSAE